MPREFEDFSDDVSKGTDKVKNSLDGISKAAADADKAHNKLSDSQKAGTAIADKYAKSLEKVSAGTFAVGEASKKAYKGLEKLASIKGNGLSGIEANITGITSAISNMDSDVSRAIDLLERLSNQEVEIKIPEPDFEFVKDFKKGTDSINADLIMLEKTASKLGKQQFLELSIELGGREAISSFLDEMDDLEKKAFQAQVDLKGLDGAVQDLAQSSPVLAANLMKAREAADELARSSSTLSGEIDKAASVTDLARKRFQEGANEAKGFAGGLGETSGKAVGAGVAVFYLAEKLAGLIDEFKGAALEAATFRRETEALEHALGGIVVPGELEDIRQRLGLTREQATEFFKVLEAGATSGVASIDKLADAGEKLRNTFGGDQTDRLREYVDLLKEIPSLDADLSISADLDDQAAALFALAEAGKIQTVIDLQAAGLAGGIQIEASKEEVNLLNVAQKTEQQVQNIKDFLVGKLFPTWGPVIGEVASGVTKVIGLLGGALALFGAMKIFLGSQIVAQNATTKAVLLGGLGGKAGKLGKAGALRKGFSRGGGGIGGVKRGVSGAIKATAFTKATTKLGKVAQIGAKGLLKVGNASKIAGGGMLKLGSQFAKAGGIWGAVALVVGIGATALADKLEESGNRGGASVARFSGELLKAGGTIASFAAMGSVIPGVGTAIGAIAGVAVVAISSLGSLGDVASGLGQELNSTVDSGKKYAGWLQSTGKALDWMGKKTSKAGAVVGDWGDLIKFGTSKVWDGVKALGGWIKGLGESAIYGDEYAASLKKAREAQDESNKYWAVIASAQSKVVKSSDKVSKAMLEMQKNTQESGMALQQQLQRTKAEFEGIKFRLFERNLEIASDRLSLLSDIGGDTGNFERAIESTTSALNEKFKKLTDSLGERRSAILKDATLSASGRKAALNELYAKEVAAVRELVEGINSVVDALLKTPSIILRGLKDELERGRFDLQIDAGALGIEDFTKGLESQFGNAFTSLTESFEAASKAEDALVKAEENLAEQSKKTQQVLSDAWSGLTDEFKKDLEGVAKVEKKTVKGLFGKETQEDVVTGIDPTKAAEALAKIKDDIEKYKDDVKATNDSIKDIPTFNIGANIKGIAKELSAQKKIAEQAKKEAQEAQEAFEKDPAAKGAKDTRAKAIENSNKEAAALVKAQKEFDGLYSQLATELRKAKVPSDLAQRYIQEQLLGQSGVLLSQKELLSVNVKLSKGSKANLEALNKRAKAVQKLNQASQVEAVLQNGVVSAYDAQKNAAQKRLDIQNNVFDLQKQVAKVIAASSRVLETKELRDMENRLSSLQAQEALASQGGDVIGALATTTDQQTKLYAARNKALTEQIAIDKENRKIAATALEDALADPKSDPKKIAVLKTTLQQFDNVMADNSKKLADNAKELFSAGIDFEKALDAVGNSLSGKKISAELDLSETLFEFSEFSKDLAGTAREGLNIAIKAAKEQRRLEEEAIKRANERAKAQVDEQAKAISDPGQKERFKAERLATIDAQSRAQFAKAELKEKKKVLEAAQREADLKIAALDDEQGLLEAQADFLSEFGGSFDQFTAIQQKSVGLEREKLAIIEEQLAVARSTGEDTRKVRALEIQAAKQALNLRRKEVGIQKDIAEKLLGKAFGQLRGSFAGSKNAFSDVALLGRAKTRVSTRSGLLTGAEGGKVKTIEERAAERQLGAGVRGKKTADGLSKGVDALLADAPKRLSIEEEMAKSLQEGNKDNKVSAAGIQKLVEAGTTPGSLYTHDVTSEGWLAKIYGFLTQSGSGTTSEAEKAKKEVADLKSKELKSLSPGDKLQKIVADKQAKEAKKLSPGEKIQQQLGKAQLKERELRMAEIRNPLAGGGPGEDIMSGKTFKELGKIEKESLKKDSDKKALLQTLENTTTGLGMTPLAEGNQQVVPESSKLAQNAEQGKREVMSQEKVAQNSMQPKPGFAAPSGDLGGGGGELPALKITGTMEVKFDNQMFRNQVVTIVGESINTGEIRKSLEQLVVFKT